MFIITQYNQCWMFLNRMNAAGLFELNIGRMNVEWMERIYKMVWMSFEIWGETEWMFDLRFEIWGKKMWDLSSWNFWFLISGFFFYYVSLNLHISPPFRYSRPCEWGRVGKWHSISLDDFFIGDAIIAWIVYSSPLMIQLFGKLDCVWSILQKLFLLNGVEEWNLFCLIILCDS